MAGNLGRIGGHLLKENLLRNGQDLAFDADLLYLKVAPIVEPIVPGDDGDTNYDPLLPSELLGTGIGINTDVPVFDLDVNNSILTTDNIVDNQANIDNIIIQANSYFTTSLGPINLFPDQSNPYIRHNRLVTDNLEINDNFIKTTTSDTNIQLSPNGSGAIELQSTTNVTGDLYVTGNIDISGNLSKQGNLILGDDVIDNEGPLPENDTIDFNVELQQSLIPGIDNGYDLGRSADDSSFGRWASLHSLDWQNADNLTQSSFIISEQTEIDGINSQIFALQSNEDITILPDSGISFVEELSFEDNTIENQLNTPISFTGTDRGYYRFAGNNGFVLPSGNNATRPTTPEIGDTRWNTQEDYLECFDGSVYVISTGAGEEITENIQEDLANLYSLILG